MSNITFDSDSEDDVAQKIITRTAPLEIKCMELHDQILHRPDTYIGNIIPTRMRSLIWVARDGKIVKNTATIERPDRRSVTQECGPLISEGFIRTIIEIVCNMIDNVWRSREFGITPRNIKVDIDRLTGRITTWNDGRPLPHSKHEKLGKYNIELLCSRLLTSTNYDDNEKKKTSGRNGYGMKLTAIFAREFTVCSYNPDAHQIYTQTWTDNMYKSTPPQITRSTGKIAGLAAGSGYTQFSWIPDFTRFGMTGFDDDTVSVIEKYVYDTAMVVSKYGVNTHYNGTALNIRSLQDYARLYIVESENESDDDEESRAEELHLFTSSDSKVVVVPFTEHLCVSFVNGILTTEGGVHVDEWCEAIFRPITNRVNGIREEKPVAVKVTRAEAEKRQLAIKRVKSTNYTVNIEQVRNHFAVFIDTEIDNPVFRGQNKTYFGGASNGTRVVTRIKASDIPKIMRWSVIDDIRRILEVREMSELKTRRGFVRIEGYDCANNSKRAAQKRRGCVLCVSEGLSAKTYVVKGMSVGLLNIDDRVVVGRDWIGVLPIRGKFINPRGKSMKTVAKNKEVQSIVQALGLEPLVDYTVQVNADKLKYGRLAVFADADKDGIHIIALLHNFFATLYPTLLQIPGFFCFNRSPIIKVDHRLDQQTFYYLEQARQYITEHNIPSSAIKYYKGLGTSRASDILTDFGQRFASMTHDTTTIPLVDNIFNPKRAQYRKRWITEHDSTVVYMPDNVDSGKMESVDYSDFVNNELVLFSIEDCKRSIPNIYDGLKEGQRKILYAVFLRGLTYAGASLKVAQLSGYVAEKTEYEHGEDNLLETARGMAHRYPGSNNMPLLYNDGQFGSRLENGRDGSSGRYIFTKQEMYTRCLYPQRDDPYLVNIVRDGTTIEKHNYISVIPVILVNGCSGIGTGFSSNIPQYDPRVLIDWVREWINLGGEMSTDMGGGLVLSEGPQLIPYYRGFLGKIEMIESVWTTSGVLKHVSGDKWRVSELPIGKRCYSITKYKERLDDMREKKTIRDYNQYGDDTIIDFVVEMNPGEIPTLVSLGLVDTIHTSNMVLFKDDHTLKRYTTPEEILDDFCKKRLELYTTRRAGEILSLDQDLLYARAQLRFLTEIGLADSDIDRLVLRDVSEAQLISTMTDRGYPLKPQLTGTYNYLLDQKIRGSTSDKLERLRRLIDRLQLDISVLNKQTACDIWKVELSELLDSYNKWLLVADDNRVVAAKPRKTVTSTKKR